MNIDTAVGWCVVSPPEWEYPLEYELDGVRRTRSAAIKAHERRTGEDWKREYARGHRCVRVFVRNLSRGAS